MAITAFMTASDPTSFSISKPGSATTTIQTLLGVPAAGPAQQVITQVLATGAYALDIGTNLLPWLGNPQLDTSTYKMAVTVDGTQPIDLFRVELYYGRGGTTYTWDTFGPTPGDVQLPTLSIGTDVMPHPPFDFSVSAKAYACQSDVINGYRPAHQNAFNSFDTCLQSTTATSPRWPGSFNRLSRSN
jgi:hypothetical protein